MTRTARPDKGKILQEAQDTTKEQGEDGKLLQRARRGLLVPLRWLRNEYLHAAVFLLLALVAMFWPALKQGRPLTTGAYLYSADQLYREGDPTYQAPLPPANAVAGDYSPFWMLYPEDIEAARAFRTGYYPLWNPYNAAGTPLLGNDQSALFNPEKLPLYLAGPRHVMQIYSFMLVARLLLAGFFTYLFARLVGVRRTGALLAGVAFMFCGINLIRFQFTDTTSVTLLPLLMGAAEWLIQRRGGRATVLLGVALGLAVLSAGHPEVALFTILGTAVYYVVRAFTYPIHPHIPGGRARQFFVALGVGLIAGAIGLAVSLAYTLPFLELVRNGGAYTTQASTVQGYGAIWNQMLLPLLLHFFYLTAPSASEFNAGIGVVAIGLVLFAPIWRGVPRTLFLLVVWCGLLLFVLPPGNVIKVVPWVIHSYYNMGVLAFALAILAGFGLQRLIETPLHGLRDGRLLVILGGGAGLLALAATSVLPQNSLLARSPLAHLGLLALLSPVLEVSAAVVLYIICRWLLRARYLGPALVVLAAVFLIGNGRDINPPQKPFTYPVTRPIAWLKRDPGPYRIAAFGSGSLIPNTGMVHHLATTTVDTFFQVQRYRQIAKLFPTLNTSYKPAILFSSFRLHLLSLLNTKYFIVDRGQPIAARVQKEPGAEAGISSLTPIYSDAYSDIYENHAALPRAFIVHQARYFKTGDPDVLAQVNNPATDFTHLALIETSTSVAPVGADLKPVLAPIFNPTEATVTRYAPDHVTIQTAATLPGYLILSDTYYPGWTATVDSHPTTIYPADYLLRGIAIPGGPHTIEFRYDPPSFKIGLWTTLATALLVLGYLLWTTVAAPKEQPLSRASRLTRDEQQPSPPARSGLVNAPDSTRQGDKRASEAPEERAEKPNSVSAVPRLLAHQGDKQVWAKPYSNPLLQHAGTKGPGALATLITLALLVTIGGFLPFWQDLRPLAPDPSFNSFIQYPTDASFGKDIKLTGYEWSTAPARPGATRTLRLYLNAVQTPHTNYTMFFHLVNTTGQEWELDDHQLNATPTTNWRGGETIIDQSDLILPPDLSPGAYQLKIGLYTSATQRRLPTYSVRGLITPSGKDSLLLVSFPVNGKALVGGP